MRLKTENLRIRHETVLFKNLPPHLKGLRILHISDLHGRSPEKMNIDIWKHIAELDFDIAAITGDVIVNDIAQIHPHMKGLSELAARVPTFFADGNHEFFYYEEISGLFQSAGVTVLNNSRSEVAHGRGSLFAAGFRDYNYLCARGFRDADSLIKEMNTSAPGRFHLVLIHQPQMFDMLEACLRVDALVLAGHTHGGQVRLPFLPTLYAPGQGINPKYGDGWFERGGTNGKPEQKMFISRGVGATVFHIRLFNKPEIAVIVLEQSAENR